MSIAAAGPAVVRFYDTHPINEEQIRHALLERGADLGALTEDTLKDLDQDHFGGIEANDILIERAGMQARHLVLDVCSGMGGPARYFAHRVGCRVVGLDLTQSRFAAAQRLTQLVHLEELVTFRHGNALAMPFDSASFDVVVGQEAWCHVPDKSRLIGECARVVKPGGVIAFTDILRRASLTPPDKLRIESGMAFQDLETLDGYRDLLAAHGFDLRHQEDLGDLWARILVHRLAMYRSLGADTARKFGVERSREWDDMYAFFVELFERRALGGGRFVAQRAG
ncbi:MAG: methyltransferase domain-containing protein [Betaproteobacteria bacterium]